MSDLIQTQTWKHLCSRSRKSVVASLRTFVNALKGGRDKIRDASENAAQMDHFRPHEVGIREMIVAQRPRVLHVIANFYIGGSSQLVVDLIERLGHRFEQSIFTRDLPPTPAYTGVHLKQCERLSSVDQASALIRAFRPHFLHVHFLGHHGNAYSEKDWEWYHQVFQAAENEGYGVLENLNIPVEPYLSSSVRCYVYVSDNVREAFAPVEARNETVYPGSDLTSFSRTPSVGTRNHGIPDDCIGMVYRLERDKLNEQSIDVFIEVIRRRPSTTALIVGDGRFFHYYRERVQQAGVADAFTFTGYVAYKDLPAMYERMSLFVAPVHRESFGQVTPFAMGMSLPVVGYRVGALEEIIGDPSLLAPPGHTGELARITTSLLDNRERRIEIGAFNRDRAVRLFSLEAMVDRYSELYEFMLNDGKTPSSPGDVPSRRADD